MTQIDLSPVKHSVPGIDAGRTGVRHHGSVWRYLVLLRKVSNPVISGPLWLVRAFLAPVGVQGRGRCFKRVFGPQEAILTTVAE